MVRCSGHSSRTQTRAGSSWLGFPVKAVGAASDCAGRSLSEPEERLAGLGHEQGARLGGPGCQRGWVTDALAPRGPTGHWEVQECPHEAGCWGLIRAMTVSLAESGTLPNN